MRGCRNSWLCRSDRLTPQDQVFPSQQRDCPLSHRRRVFTPARIVGPGPLVSPAHYQARREHRASPRKPPSAAPRPVRSDGACHTHHRHQEFFPGRPQARRHCKAVPLPRSPPLHGKLAGNGRRQPPGHPEGSLPQIHPHDHAVRPPEPRIPGQGSANSRQDGFAKILPIRCHRARQSSPKPGKTRQGGRELK